MPSKIAERIDGMGRRLTNMLPSTQGGFLTNKWMLYLVLFSAIFDLFYFYQKGDMHALTLFFIIGFLVSFFSKNMVVILILAIVLTHLIRYGKDLSEGFKEKEEDDEAFEEKEEGEGFEEDEKEGFEEKDEEGFEEEEEEKKEEKKEAKNGFKNIASSNVDAQAQALIANQNKLMESMETLKPMLAKAEGFLQSVGPKKDGFATLSEAYGPLKR